ncbi:amidohydrolase [Pseudomonas sp. 5P_3.1_Bac2]|uniref:amidohydrolase n=1 Tax=Pseudomonas sp. 5P_3.1_Bac2 TaxID=2971617 RepID=UPI0021C8BFD5|nr:amidohydrolase [Pseudomonas sp. 5P_3.1_Bac2]MCU1719360.1 amidohydrolase [Pseudomonas sp. 5P_3.1_Bac2]
MKLRTTTPSALSQALALSAALSLSSGAAQSQEGSHDWVKAAADGQAAQVIEWRRHLHQNPELGNQELKTSAFVAEHLRQMGLEVHSGVAGTGVVAVLHGAHPGPTVGLRADMDALPIKEATGLPFASQAQGQFFGKTVDVMHACGHDGHTSMLLGAAQILSAHQDQVSGTVVFIFQPAEEGPSNIDIYAKNAQSWGARRMVQEGVIEQYGIQAMFALHVLSSSRTGHITYKVGTAFNSSDSFRIRLHGTQTHGSAPWLGADPIVAAGSVISAMQTLVSRRTDVTQGMGVVSVGSIHAGTANNIIPADLEMQGTIRADNARIRKTLTEALPDLVEQTAAAQQVKAETKVVEMMPLTINSAQLTRALAPAMSKAADGNAKEVFQLLPGSEDFAYFAEKVPGMYVFLGQTAPGIDLATAPVVHSPNVMLDENTLVTGVRAHIEFVLGYAEYAKQLTPHKVKL